MVRVSDVMLPGMAVRRLFRGFFLGLPRINDWVQAMGKVSLHTRGLRPPALVSDLTPIHGWECPTGSGIGLA